MFVPQNTDYDPNDQAAEKIFAKDNKVGWVFRGHLTRTPGHAKPKWFGNQKVRKSGRFANRGGFRKKKQNLHMVSNWDDFFHPDNTNGLLAFLCRSPQKTRLQPRSRFPGCTCMQVFCVLPHLRLETNVFVVVHLVLHPGSPNIDPHIRMCVCVCGMGVGRWVHREGGGGGHIQTLANRTTSGRRSLEKHQQPVQQ